MIKLCCFFVGRYFIKEGVSVKNPYQKYQKAKVDTANQAKLILMLYDGAIKFLNFSIEKLREKDYEQVNTYIIKAQNIITELMLSLNMEVGGDLAKNLYSLYDFMNRRLIEANVKKNSVKGEKTSESIQLVNDVLSMLKELRQTWAEAAKRAGKDIVKTP
jgi:flagellar protein FliS